jgi:hypothetical protein
VLIHGGSLMLLGKRHPLPSRPGEPTTPPSQSPEPRRVSLPVINPAEPAAAPQPAAPSRISIEELKALQAAGEPVIILDVRKPRTLEESETTAQGAIRVDPERPVLEAERLKLPKEAWLVAFCA